MGLGIDITYSACECGLLTVPLACCTELYHPRINNYKFMDGKAIQITTGAIKLTMKTKSYHVETKTSTQPAIITGIHSPQMNCLIGPVLKSRVHLSLSLSPSPSLRLSRLRLRVVEWTRRKSETEASFDGRTNSLDDLDVNDEEMVHLRSCGWRYQATCQHGLECSTYTQVGQTHAAWPQCRVRAQTKQEGTVPQPSYQWPGSEPNTHQPYSGDGAQTGLSWRPCAHHAVPDASSGSTRKWATCKATSGTKISLPHCAYHQIGLLPRQHHHAWWSQRGHHPDRTRDNRHSVRK